MCFFLLAVVLVNLLFSFGVFELVLRFQNSLASVFWVGVVRKSLLFVFLGVIFLLIKSVKSCFVGVDELWQDGGVLFYILCFLIYLFCFFFPRQRYFNEEAREWQVGFKKKD